MEFMSAVRIKRYVKRYTRVVIIFGTGMVMGAMGDRFLTKMRAYANFSAHTTQCRAILQQIADYREQHGSDPDQEWFASLGGLTKTCEGFQWIYLNPPLRWRNGKEVVILTATRHNDCYLCGFSDRTVMFHRFHLSPVAQQR